MSGSSTRAARTNQRDKRGADVLLDDVRNPYGPCPGALEAAAADSESPATLAAQLQRRLGQVYRTAGEAISLVPGREFVLSQIVNASDGPLVCFPPSTLAASLRSLTPEREIIALARGVGPAAEAPLDLATDLPADGLAVLDSPSDPLGSLLSTLDAVRLARACRYLVVDERYAELAGFSLLHLSVEFDNIVVVRSFEYWAGIDEPPCAWIATSPRAAAALGLEGALPRWEALAGALATLANLDSVEATLRLLREERSRLYRFVRKLSFLEPIPSWGPFLAARVHLTTRDRVVSGLARRGIQIYAPEEPGLEQHVRLGIGSRSAMDRLRAALQELGAELLA